MEWLICLLVLMSVNSQYVGIPRNNASSSICTDQNHIFLAPGVLTAGASNRACVSRFHADGPARLILTLFTEDRQAVTASRELPPGDGGCVDITVPQLPNTRADLVVNIRYPDAHCTWERRVVVRVSSGRVLAVHTERARYRPGDTLRARLFALKADLTPSHGIIDDIWLEGPRGAWEGSRAAQWVRVRSRLGAAQVQHQLDALAPHGRWTLRARLGDGSQGSAVFWVGNYELPPFQLSVRHAARVLRTSERLVWTVCVRYPWTEAVEGMLVIRIRGAGTPTSDGTNGIRTAVRLRAPRACHRHAAAARRIGLDSANSPDVVVADFSFQEEGTRIWQNTTVVSQVVDKPVTLEFLTKHRAVISPGLPYKLKIKAIRFDDKPASDQRIRVCRSPASHASDLTQGPVTSASAKSMLTDGACEDALTDASGIARVLFSADNDGSPFYRLQASLQNDTNTTTSPLYLPVQRQGGMHAALGPLKADVFATRTFVPLYLNMRNISNAITVHFVVITRGGIIYRWGATTQCPGPNTDNQIETAARNSPCNANLARNDGKDGRFNGNVSRVEANKPRLDVNVMGLDGNESDALQDRHMLRVMLPIKVTHQMCPDSHLVAYFYYNGELVSASKHFEMEECFGSKVEATWQSRQAAPGSTTALNITTTGPAICALTALDSAAKWVHPGQNIKDVIMGGLRRVIDGHRNLTEYDAAGECFLTSDTPDLPTSSMELTTMWLAAAGVRVLGGTAIRSRSCQSTAPLSLTADESTVPRSDFSEAWLWRLVGVGANGSAIASARAPDSITRFEASAVCITRTGVAISAPAVLQVFREFFIHADSPKRLRRGDNTIIRYRLFNYLYEGLSVQIQILTDPHLEGPSDNVDSACIAARSSIARRVEVRAKLPGNARVSVRAKSVRDGSCVNATSSRSDVSDEVIIEMTIDPEGFPVHDQKSMLLCGKGSTESSNSEVSWNWPKVQAVPGTETLTIWAISDITGPLLADADDLVMLPRGCGEQNMARMATNLLSLKQLDPRSATALSAREHVARGFTRQLQYMHPSGGFSAFGVSDATPSTWLTGFVVRYLRKAHQVLTPGLPEPPALQRAEQWLLSQQMENGCFRNEGQVFHRELRGGLNEDGEIASVTLTAYVITSLLDSSMTLSSRILRNTLSCLRALPPLKTKNPARVYAHSLLAYAFMRLRSYEDEIRTTNEASLLDRRDGKVGALEQDEEMRELMELLKLARRNGDFVWWETGSLSTSIEATGYALLALANCPPSLRDSSCAHDARGAIRWLSTHRNAAGGFVATQDTLIALEALIAWSTNQPSSPTDLSMTAQSSGSVKTVNIRSGVLIPEVMKMGDGVKLNVNVQGTGCAVVQATRSYNAYSSDEGRDKLLSVQVSVHTDGPFNCDGNGTSCFCAAVVEACVLWTGAFPEMALLEVALPGGFGADASLLYSQLHQSNTLLRRIELSSTSTRATLYLGARDGHTLARGGHQCYTLHAVGPGTRTKPAYAKIMDYYRPMLNDTQMYTIPEDCPPRISHESNQYISSDNLFNKAKSLSDGDGVTFEDIPEGIPLEDPLYHNLIDGKRRHYEIQELISHTNDKNGVDAVKDSVFDGVANSTANVVLEDNLDKTEVIKTQDKAIRIDALNDMKSIDDININTRVNKSVKIQIDDKLAKLDDDTDKALIKPADVLDENNNTQGFIAELDNIKDKKHSKAELKATEANIQNETARTGKSEDKFSDKLTLYSQNEIPKSETKDHTIEITDYSNQTIETTDKINQESNNNVIKDLQIETNTENKVENPNLSDFHVIDTERDLEVPGGMEGPVPSVVLPPPHLQHPRGHIVMPPPGNPYAHYGVPWSLPSHHNQRLLEAIYPAQYYYQPVGEFRRNIRFKRYLGI